MSPTDRPKPPAKCGPDCRPAFLKQAFQHRYSLPHVALLACLPYAAKLPANPNRRHRSELCNARTAVPLSTRIERCFVALRRDVESINHCVATPQPELRVQVLGLSARNLTTASPPSPATWHPASASALSSSAVARPRRLPPPAGARQRGRQVPLRPIDVLARPAPTCQHCHWLRVPSGRAQIVLRACRERAVLLNCAAQLGNLFLDEFQHVARAKA